MLKVEGMPLNFVKGFGASRVWAGSLHFPRHLFKIMDEPGLALASQAEDKTIAVGPSCGQHRRLRRGKQNEQELQRSSNHSKSPKFAYGPARVRAMRFLAVWRKNWFEVGQTHRKGKSPHSLALRVCSFCDQDITATGCKMTIRKLAHSCCKRLIGARNREIQRKTKIIRVHEELSCGF